MKKIFIYLSLVLIVGFVTAVLYCNYYIHQNINKENPVKISIPKGIGVGRIVEILNKEDLAEPKWLFEIYLKYLSVIDKKYLQAGVYLFPKDITTSELIDALFTSKYLYIARVTFPEGLTYLNFASILQKDALVDSASFVKYAESDSLLNARRIGGKSVEGYLLPDTYEIYMESSAKDVIDKLLNAHERMFNRINSQSSNPQKLSRHEILTLASIVEAETPDDSERSKVAGLYINRIKKKMLLQADPTVAYALGSNRRILYNDLKSKNPYNTYKFKGLPPGPINNPGAKSIRAALNPDSHDYIYMVTIGDGTRRHNFSKSFSEHKKYVSQYRRRLKSQPD